MTTLNLLETKGGTTLHVKVVPNSSRAEIVGLLGDALKVKVAQPPEDGKANRGVETLIAGALGVAVSQVKVVGGKSQARKTVHVAGMTATGVRERLSGFV